MGVGWRKESGVMPIFLALAIVRMVVSFTVWEEQGGGALEKSVWNVRCL